jgi:hypothetical protein
MGFYSITEHHHSPNWKIKNQDREQVRNGDIIIANFTGYVDVLYYKFKYSPQFVLNNLPESLVLVSFWEIMLFLMFGHYLKHHDAIILDTKKHNSSPIILFIEVIRL